MVLFPVLTHSHLRNLSRYDRIQRIWFNGVLTSLVKMSFGIVGRGSIWKSETGLEYVVILDKCFEKIWFR